MERALKTPSAEESVLPKRHGVRFQQGECAPASIFKQDTFVHLNVLGAGDFLARRTRVPPLRSAYVIRSTWIEESNEGILFGRKDFI